MLYDLIVNQPYKWYKECAKDLRIGVPPMDFTPALVREAVPFLIDDVASHYFNHPKEYVPDDFHNLAPRYPIMWLEFTQPKRGLIGDTWVDYEGDLKQVTDAMTTMPLLALDYPSKPMDIDITKMVRGVYLRSWDRFNEEDADTFRNKYVSAKARWLYRSVVFMTIDGNKISDAFSGMSFQVDDKGEIIFFDGPKKPYIFDIPIKTAQMIGIEQIKSHVTGSMMPAVMTLAMIQCRNVYVETTPPRQAKLRKPQTRRARRAAKKLPSDASYYAHHRIQVDPYSAGRKKASSGESSGQGVAWHRVPGGFRTYDGKINPETGKKSLLFGKYRCTIYVPAFERGTTDQGTITKDYEMQLSNE